MPRNVGPTRLEAQIGKRAKRHGGRLVLAVALVVVAVLGYLSIDYASAYSGVIEAVGIQEVAYRGRKNRGLTKVQQKCLTYRVFGEAEPRIDCRLPDSILDEFRQGDSFVKPRFASRPFPLRTAAVDDPSPVAP